MDTVSVPYTMTNSDTIDVDRTTNADRTVTVYIRSDGTDAGVAGKATATAAHIGDAPFHILVVHNCRIAPSVIERACLNPVLSVLVLSGEDMRLSYCDLMVISHRIRGLTTLILSCTPYLEDEDAGTIFEIDRWVANLAGMLHLQTLTIRDIPGLTMVHAAKFRRSSFALQDMSINGVALLCGGQYTGRSL
jgi:hypothetical protein